jgi:hypothetical protein
MSEVEVKEEKVVENFGCVRNVECGTNSKCFEGRCVPKNYGMSCTHTAQCGRLSCVNKICT